MTHQKRNEGVDSLALPASLLALPPPGQPHLIHSPEEVRANYWDIAEEVAETPPKCYPSHPVPPFCAYSSLCPLLLCESESQLHVLHLGLIRPSYH